MTDADSPTATTRAVLGRTALPPAFMPYKVVVTDGREDPADERWHGEEACGAERTVKRVFDGQCYHCGHANHSQNFCPLRLCSTCGRYGHGDRACWLGRSRT